MHYIVSIRSLLYMIVYTFHIFINVVIVDRRSFYDIALFKIDSSINGTRPFVPLIVYLFYNIDKLVININLDVF